MEFRELRYFLAVAEELHFGRAAARVGIAQPPLSQAIRKLERELGVTLFRRSSRHVALTPGGEELQFRARTLLAARDETAAAVRRVGAGEQGVLRIGFSASAALGILPEIVRAYRAQFPSVALEVIEYDAFDTEAELLAGRFDLAILRGPLRARRIAVETLAMEPLLLALAVEHPLAGRGDLRLADMADEPFVMFPRRGAPVLYDAIISACADAGFSPHVVQEATSWPAVASLVAAGIGVTIAPASGRFLHPHGLAFRDVVGPEGRAELAAAWLEETMTPTARHFLHIVRAWLPRHGLGGKGQGRSSGSTRRQPPRGGNLRG